jgi:hypothetical protein
MGQIVGIWLKQGQNRAKTGLLPGYGPNTCCFRPVLAIFLEEWVKSGVFGQNSSNTRYTRNPGYLAIFLEEPGHLAHIPGYGLNTGYLAYIPGYGPNTWVLGLF